jgi:hypothetical protein
VGIQVGLNDACAVGKGGLRRQGGDTCSSPAEGVMTTDGLVVAVEPKHAVTEPCGVHASHRSSTTSSRGCEQQMSALPSAGSSTGSGLY